MSRTSTGSSSRREPRAETERAPTRPEAIEARLEELGVRPSRALGQSFLADPFVADALAAVARAPPSLPLFEVGGGLGAVTEAFLRRGASGFTVVERDPRLAGHLRSTFGDEVHVVEADALAFPFPAEAVVAGSLPYSVATPLLLERMRRGTRRLAAIVQKEVANRFGAGPGSRAYGRPSILAALFGSVELLQEVPPAAFWPRPKVASRMLVHTARTDALPVRSVPRLEAIVRTLFSARRKQLGNLLPRVAGVGAAAPEVARRADWPSGWSTLRPEALEPEAFFRLERALGPERASGSRPS